MRRHAPEYFQDNIDDDVTDSTTRVLRRPASMRCSPTTSGRSSPDLGGDETDDE